MCCDRVGEGVLEAMVREGMLVRVGEDVVVVGVRWACGDRRGCVRRGGGGGDIRGCVEVGEGELKGCVVVGENVLKALV